MRDPISKGHVRKRLHTRLKLLHEYGYAVDRSIAIESANYAVPMSSIQGQGYVYHTDWRRRHHAGSQRVLNSSCYLEYRTAHRHQHFWHVQILVFSYLWVGVVLSLKKRDAAALFLLSVSCLEAFADNGRGASTAEASPSASSLASSNWFCAYQTRVRNASITCILLTANVCRRRCCPRQKRTNSCMPYTSLDAP